MKYSLLLIFISVLHINSQVQEEWVRIFNSPANLTDYSFKIGLDSSNNVICVGSVDLEDIVILKYSGTGDLIWSNIYNSSNGYRYEHVNELALDKFSNIYVTGENGSIMVTSKFDSTGNLVWAKKYYSGFFCSGWSIDIDVNSNSYVVGSEPGGMVIFKYSPEGLILWQKKLRNSNFGTPNKIKVEGNSIIITTFEYVSNVSNDDMLTIKLNTSGDSLWAKRYDSGNYDHPFDFDIDIYGNIYVGGQSEGSLKGYNDYVFTLIKYDSVGNQNWVRKYRGTHQKASRITTVKVDHLGNIYASGPCNFTNTFYDYTIVKYNTFGDSLWVRRYNGIGNGDDYVSQLTSDELNDIYVTGYSVNLQNRYDLTSVKYNQYGNLQWSQSYPSEIEGSMFANATIASSDLEVYVLGTINNGINNDVITIKYRQESIGIIPINSEIPKQFSLSQNYPNPFNPTSKIRFGVPNNSTVKLVVYDAIGREVKLLVNEELKPGIYEVNFDGTNLPSGIYFCKLFADDFRQTVKMVLIK